MAPIELDSLLRPPLTVYRSMTPNGALERIGLGFLDKSGMSIDEAGGARPTYSLVHVLRGRGHYGDAHGNRSQLAAGSCFQRRPGVTHSLTIDPDSRWLECWVDFGPALYDTLRQLQCVRGLPESWNGKVQVVAARRCRQLVDQLAAATDLELPAMMADALGLHAQFVTTVRMSHDDTDIITRACSFLAEVENRSASLRSFCHTERVSYDRFRKQFQRFVGCAPEQYRIRRRIERACQLLEGSNETITAIAQRLGYSSAFEFSAQFRKSMGIPPSHYRGHRER